MRAKLAAAASWKNTDDRSARTLAARLAFNSRFEREVDPDNTLVPAERAKRAEAARREYFARLAYKSARARRRRGAMDKHDSTRPGDE